MSAPREAPNPLRPYHIPEPAVPLPAVDTARPASASRPAAAAAIAPHSSLRSSARDVLSDLDYGDYLPEAAPPVAETLKRLFDQGLWKYTSVLLAQPFELAKTVLQVQDAGAVADGEAAAAEQAAKPARMPRYGREYTVGGPPRTHRKRSADYAVVG